MTWIETGDNFCYLFFLFYYFIIMALNVVTSSNIANPWATLLTTRISEEYLKVFEPELLFRQFSEAPISQKGYNSVTWRKPQRYDVTSTQAEMSPWVTPNGTELRMDSITVTSKQYGLYTVLSDELLDQFDFASLPAVVNDLVMQNLARIIDRVVQNEVLDNATNRFYAATTSWGVRAANRAALASGNKMFILDTVFASTRLQGNFAPFINGQYFCLIHPNVYFSLQTETNIGWFIDVAKYATPDKIYKGEVGMYGNVRIIRSAYIKTYQSTIKVYPTLFIGGQAYGAAQLQDIQVIEKALGSWWVEDPLNQRMSIGAKVHFASKILQQASIQVFESAGYDS